MHALVFPVPFLRRTLANLARGPEASVLVHAGERRTAAGREWLVLGAGSDSPGDAPEGAVPFRIMRGVPASPLALSPSSGDGGILVLGDGPARGQVSGLVHTSSGTAPLDLVVLVGPGMHCIRTENAALPPLSSAQWPPPHPYSPQHPQRPSVAQGDRPDPRPGAPAEDVVRWSRSIGALGGEAVWRRLIRLRFGLVGCGRGGSVLALSLARLGVRRMCLIDPDRILPHNLGEGEYLAADLGRPKAEALADRVREILAPAPADLSAVVAPLGDPSAVPLARECDILCAFTDNDASRLCCALLGAFDHKLVLDAGTGILPASSLADRSPPRAPTPTRRMGADVRLIYPGDGCLLCRGGLADLQGAIEDVSKRRPPADLGASWSRQRAGSLRSLNQLAAGLAVRMLEDAVAGTLESSTWAHVEYSSQGRCSVQYPDPAPPPPPSVAGGCLLCAKAGLGDEALRWTAPSPEDAYPGAARSRG